MRREREDELHIHVDFPQFSHADLLDFEEWLDKFREQKTVEWKGEKKTINPINFDEAMVAFGAMRKHMYLGSPTYGIIMQPIPGERGKYIFPSKFDLFQDKYRQLQEIQAKRQFAKEQQLNDYSKMSEGLANGKRV